VKRSIVLRSIKNQGEVRLDDNEISISGLGAAMSPAWMHGSRRVEESALPKSVESSYLSVNKAVIRGMSVKTGWEEEKATRRGCPGAGTCIPIDNVGGEVLGRNNMQKAFLSGHGKSD
jgi:hypothetical protein